MTTTTADRGDRFTITEEDPGTPDLLAILEAHLAQMRAQTPPEHVHALDLKGLRDPSVRFFALRENGEALGVGALKRLDATHGELKSMHTLARARGRGAGAAMLAHLLDQAREQGFARVSLETGETEDFHPAIRLYRRHGFEPCGPFGSYTAAVDTFSTFMTRALD